MKVSAIIPAAGMGIRMGSSIPKQFLLLNGKPILHHTLSVLDQCSIVNEIILVVADKEIENSRQQIEDFCPKVTQVIVGGKERQDSVYNGLQNLDSKADIVMVHDGVRPFVSEDLIRESVEAARKFGAAITAIPVSDTIKKVNSESVVESTIDRSGLWRVQTPQTFQVSLLKEAFAKAQADNFYGTDEGSLIEYLGKDVKVVPGSELNIKITRSEDLVLGEKIAELFRDQEYTGRNSRFAQPGVPAQSWRGCV
jgi:2-C-methyl-D-erythritol 4-phosphate cytidylyltransferase